MKFCQFSNINICCRHHVIKKLSSSKSLALYSLPPVLVSSPVDKTLTLSQLLNNQKLYFLNIQYKYKFKFHVFKILIRCSITGTPPTLTIVNIFCHFSYSSTFTTSKNDNLVNITHVLSLEILEARI